MLEKLYRKSGLILAVRPMVVVLAMSCCYSAHAVEDEIPAELPNLAAIQAYQKYLGQTDQRAFAIARDGAFAYAFGQDSEQEAKEDALAACNQRSFSFDGYDDRRLVTGFLN